MRKPKKALEIDEKTEIPQLLLAIRSLKERNLQKSSNRNLKETIFEEDMSKSNEWKRDFVMNEKTKKKKGRRKERREKQTTKSFHCYSFNLSPSSGNSGGLFTRNQPKTNNINRKRWQKWIEETV